VGDRLGVLAERGERQASVVEGVGFTLPIANLPGDRQMLFVEFNCAAVFAKVAVGVAQIA
jgi:hypothetical protein